MPILVSDTSVVIDLERGALIQALFGLPFDVAVPDLLFHSELGGPVGVELVDLGLRVEELTPEELRRATLVARDHAKLSAQDCFAFALAEQRNWTLVTGDGALRQVASDHEVEVHGLLWLCDRFEEHGVVSSANLHAGLTCISGHPQCRLPAAEVAARLAKYAAT